uniref:Transcription factor TFIIB cyclin-like domain-containing protein n=1 Tax=viral metagenome TaxID=1070528 RepID=A0A6C0AQ59_9ZZZZ
MSKDKSQKQKHNNINKAELWNIFDSEVENPDKQKIPLECIYGSGNREICERCEVILAFSDEGFLTCTNPKCGIVYKDLVDHSAEWRYYGADDNQQSDPTRCGMPINPLLEESSYGCKVLCYGPMSYEMRKIRRYTEWQSMPYKEKSQYDDFQTISIMAQNSGIPKMIIDDAIVYHKKISEYELTFRGDNRDGILAASIYISCRVNNYPRTAKEIATIFRLDVTSATKGCKNALAIINNLEKDMDNKEKTNFGQTKPESFIERYCSKLNINTELTKLCQFISIKIEKQHIMPENTPPSIAAGVVYFISQICKLNISKKDVKTVSEISEVTINKCYKKLEKIKDDLIPSSILKKYSS